MASGIIGSIARVDQLTGNVASIDVTLAEAGDIGRAMVTWSPGEMFNWTAIADFWPDRSILCARLTDMPLALVQIDDDYLPLRAAPHDQRAVYVSFLEVAPPVRNRAWYSFAGLGAAMLSFAFARSRQLGYHGRIGLHAIEPAREFYAKLGFLIGSRPGPNEYWESYLELSPEAADRFVENSSRS